MAIQSSQVPLRSLLEEYVTLRERTFSFTPCLLLLFWRGCPIRHVGLGSIFSLSGDCRGHRVCVLEIQKGGERGGGYYAYGWHSFSIACAWACLGAICGESKCLNDYLRVGGIHSQLVIVAWWETARGLWTQVYRPLTHLPPGVCVREKHEHLYVSRIPVWCVCVGMCLWYSVNRLQ